MDFLRISVLVMVGLVGMVSSADGTLAQTSQTENSTDETKLEDSAGSASEETIAQMLDALARQTDPAQAKRLEKRIWNAWTNSGSATVDVMMQWVAVSMRKKEYGTALDLLDQVTILAPAYAEGWNRRATLYFLRADFSRSIADIEQVLKLEPRHFGALSGLGNILVKLNQHEKALEIWRKVLDIYPANKSAQKSVINLEEKLAGEGI